MTKMLVETSSDSDSLDVPDMDMATPTTSATPAAVQEE
jgi:hypothetical protein